MRRALFAAMVTFAAPLALFVPVYADANNFVVTDFTADYYLSTSDLQGSLGIQEHLTVDFSDQNHGILRALPQKYNGQNEHLKISGVKLDGASEQYSTYTSNGNEVLKIGNPDSTITGRHTYDINYSVQNVIRFTHDHDELDWNTNGTEWTQPFEAITARLHVPTGLAAKLDKPDCFVGAQGSTVHDCTVVASGDITTFTTTRALDSSETMTFAADFPLGTFQKPTAADWWRDHSSDAIGLLAPAVIALAIAYPYWRKNGKDIRGRGTIIPEYAPPAGLRAAEADVISTYKLGNKAISATIIDLAIRKYLKISEGTSNGVLGLGKHKTYTLERLPAPAGDQLKPYEQQILNALFPAGDTTDIASLKTSFYMTAQAMRKDLPASLTFAGYFPANPRRVGNVLHLLGSVLAVGGVAIGGPTLAWHISFVLAGLVFLGFGWLMPRRTQMGVDAKDQLAGLKLYMDVAEKDRLAKLQSVDAPYAPKSAEPTKTVELFEKLLPYAIVLGVETSWAKQFEGIYTSPPDWYGGNWQTFNTLYFVNSLNASVGAMNSSFAAPASSGSGAGGGFAGGGGGGGGGGGW